MRHRLLHAAVLALFLTSCRAEERASRRSVGSDTLPVLVGAGDVADCTNDNHELTARILDTIGGTVFVAGDAGYIRKRVPDPLRMCYNQSWGRHRGRTRPAAGNHEYENGSARLYFEYFGASAAPPNGYYSYSLGTWHVVVLNTAIDVSEESAQMEWLRTDLATATGRCVVAYMHHPRFSSGPHKDRARIQPIWKELARHATTIAIAGHDHIYERFAPLNADGDPDSLGVRQFVVGTGGASTYDLERVLRGSEARATRELGVLKLTLLPGRYQWEFIPVNPNGYKDRGESTCHVTHASH